jgi:hypothetical protein
MEQWSTPADRVVALLEFARSSSAPVASEPAFLVVRSGARLKS